MTRQPDDFKNCDFCRASIEGKECYMRRLDKRGRNFTTRGYIYCLACFDEAQTLPQEPIAVAPYFEIAKTAPSPAQEEHKIGLERREIAYLDQRDYGPSGGD